MVRVSGCHEPSVVALPLILKAGRASEILYQLVQPLSSIFQFAGIIHILLWIVCHNGISFLPYSKFSRPTIFKDETNDFAIRGFTATSGRPSCVKCITEVHKSQLWLFMGTTHNTLCNNFADLSIMHRG
jgi:hypothetical protein